MDHTMNASMRLSVDLKLYCHYFMCQSNKGLEVWRPVEPCINL